MQVLLLSIQDGNAEEKEEGEVTQEHMQYIDEAELDVFKFENGHFYRATISAQDDERSIEWMRV